MTNSEFTSKLDNFLDRLYRNPEKPRIPKSEPGQIWAMPSKILSFPWATSPNGRLAPGEEYFLHYYQNQRYGTITDNECVTTSALMSMNMLTDWVAASLGRPLEPAESLGDFVSRLDRGGVLAWQFRFPSRSILPGFMTPWQAVITLRQRARELKKRYGKSYTVRLSAWHVIDDLSDRLWEGKLVLLHGAWKMSVDHKRPGYNPLLAWLGGMPHTVILVGYHSETDTWSLLNPAEPWPTDHKTQVRPKLHKMSSDELMAFWGRQFLFYPPRFAITTIALD